MVRVGSRRRRAGAALAGRGEEQFARVRHRRARPARRTADRGGSARARRFSIHIASSRVVASAGTRAQEFANEWRARLYAEQYDHRDPVHDAPTADELAVLPLWASLDKIDRLQLTMAVLGESTTRDASLTAVSRADERQLRFLHRVVAPRWRR